MALIFSLALCTVITSSCKNLIDLRKHFDTHSSEPAYHCDFEDCDYTTRSMQSIKSHYKRVHEVRHVILHSGFIVCIYIRPRFTTLHSSVVVYCFLQTGMKQMLEINVI